MFHIDDMIKDCEYTITFTKNEMKIAKEYNYPEDEKDIKLELKVLKDIIRSLKALKLKYEDNFECDESDYK